MRSSNRWSVFSLILALVLVLAPGATAQDPVMVKDIKVKADSHSQPYYLTNLNGKLFFSATRSDVGSELFMTDPATNVTTLVADINPGSVGSAPAYLTVVNGWLCFRAYDGTTGYELWRTNGTTTERLADIYPGVGSGNPQPLGVVGNTLYFMASDPEYGNELWSTDGTTVTFVKDINPEVSEDGVPSSSYLYYLTDNGTTMYCRGYNYATSRYEMFAISADHAAYIPLADPDETFNYINPLGFVGDVLYAYGSSYVDQGLGDGPEYVGSELWKVTPTGAELIDLYPGSHTNTYTYIEPRDPPTYSYTEIHSSSPSLVAQVGEVLYIRAYSGTADGQNPTGYELFKITAAGVEQVIDLYPGTYLYENSSVTSDRVVANSSSPQRFAVHDGKLYFTATTPDQGREIWVTDPAMVDDPETTEVEGTSLFLDVDGDPAFNSNSYPLAELPDKLIFRASTPDYGHEPWSLDWATGTATMMADLVEGTSSSSTSYLGTANGKVFLRSYVSDGSTSSYLYWATDGVVTEQNDELAELEDLDFIPGDRYANWDYVTEAGGKLYFRADDFEVGYELFCSDGTAAGTGLCADIEPMGRSTSNPIILGEINGRIVFTADDGRHDAAHGTELWSTTGDEADTVLIGDIYPGWNSSSPSLFAILHDPAIDKDVIILRANHPDRGQELWKTDGTVGGLTALPEISPGTGSPSPYLLFERDGWVYFRTYLTSTGYELWRTDGTEVEQFTDIWPGTTDYTYVNNGTEYSTVNRGISYPFGSIGSTVFLRAESGDSDGRNPTGWELFKVTDTGVELVADLYPGYYTNDYYVYTDGGDPRQYPNSSNPAYLANINVGQADEKILFRAYDGTSYSLYTVDAAGTVVNVHDPDGPNYFSLLAVAGGKAYFNHNGPDPDIVPDPDIQYSGLTGNELWVWDDAAGEMSLVKDLYPGGSFSTWTSNDVEYTRYNPNSSHPRFFAVHNGLLLFLASDPDVGQELFSTDGTAANTKLVKDINPLIYTYPDGRVYPYGSSPRYPTAFEGSIYFRANDGFHGYEMWKTDGTAATTKLVADIAPGPSSGNFYYPIIAHGQMYFLGSSVTHGNELWVSDGTAQGTNELFDLNPGVASSTPYPFGEYLGSSLYFRADDGPHGQELWRVDPRPNLAVDFFENGDDIDWVALKPMEFTIAGSTYGGETLLLKGTLNGVPIADSGTSAMLTTPSGDNPVSATFTWTPEVAKAGDYELRFEITDADGNNAVSWTIDIKVAGDSDNDGLPDLWETEGYTTVDGVFVDLPNLTGEYLSEGARPDRPDIFIELDWMESAEISHEPLNQAILWIVQSFQARGIMVHIIVDDAVPFFESLGSDPSSYDWTEFDNLKAAYFTREYQPAFRYCLFAHQLGPSTDPSTQSGISRNLSTSGSSGASDLVVSLGAWEVKVGVDDDGNDVMVPGGSQEEQAGTLMHELGHNLGLFHGGHETKHNKPNYLSVMNYSFQFGLRIEGLDPLEKFRKFDYSFMELNSLGELGLYEEAGLRTRYQDGDGNWVFDDIPGMDGYQTRWFNAYGILQDQPAGADLNSPIDWDGGGISTSAVYWDLNGDYSFATLTGYNDWDNLKFTGGLVGGGGIPLPQVSESEELEIEEAREVYLFEEPDPNPNPPVAVAVLDEDYTYLVTGTEGTAQVSFDGSQSTDVEENQEDLTHWWYEGDDLVGIGATLAANFAPGYHVVTLVVEDSSLKSEPVDVTFSVVSRRALEARASPDVLQPVDDTMRLVGLSVAPAYATCVATSVTSNESISGPGADGDWDDGPDQSSIYLRASRTSDNLDRIYSVTYETMDGSRVLVTGTVEIMVPAPPRLTYTAALTPNILRSVNHKLVEVTLSVEPSYLDAVITGVTCNQADDGNGDGKTSPDWQLLTDDPTVVLLRAERSGQDGDRIYTVAFTVTATSGLSADGTATVVVPHDQGQQGEQDETAPADNSDAGAEAESEAGGDGEAEVAVEEEAEVGVEEEAEVGVEVGVEEAAGSGVGDQAGAGTEDPPALNGGSSGDSEEEAEGDGAETSSSLTDAGSAETLTGDANQQAGASKGGTEPAGAEKPEGPQGTTSSQEFEPTK